jgi:hypothetical protein
VWVRHKKSGTFWARLSPHLYHLASTPSGPGSGLRKLVLTSCFLTLLSKEALVLVMEKHDYSKLCF